MPISIIFYFIIFGIIDFNFLELTFFNISSLCLINFYFKVNF